jgi:predicted nucleotidyltransferase
MHDNMLPPTPLLAALRARLGAEWPALDRAREASRARVLELHRQVNDRTPTDASLVVFGSVARGEVTADSDVDWTLLIDGQAHPSHLNAALDIETSLVEAGLKRPGREGTFGGLAFSHELLHRIGGSEDTNRNTTQRILLLLESHAIGNGDAHRRVLTQVLKRYVDEDFGLLVHGSNLSSVPRFLLNDIVRYWRTVAVDFAYKRRERQAAGWALRTAKLRMSRKLTYASGLAACFSCAMELKGAPTDAPGDRALRTVDHLERFLQQPPLEIMAWAVSGGHANERLREAGRRLFFAYDRFLALLDDRDKRERLDALLPSDAAADAVYNEAREIGHAFQAALDEIFLTENGSQLFTLTRTYGVF